MIRRKRMLCAPSKWSFTLFSSVFISGRKPAAMSFLYALVSIRKNKVSKIMTLIIITGRRWRLQKKSTPFINPIKSGGSPTGVRQPPIFEMRKMKNTIICTLRWRHLFARIIGRIISILAPVVPMQLDKSVPKASRHTLTRGEPAKSPSIVMLPETQKSPNKRTIKVR